MSEMLDKVVKATEELREVLTEGHQLLKDLKQERKKVERLLAEVDDHSTTLTHDYFKTYIKPRLDIQLQELLDVIKATQDASVERVTKTFTGLENTLLYGNAQGRGESWVDEAVNNGQAPFQNGGKGLNNR